jgi:uncharacterized membrane protein
MCEMIHAEQQEASRRTYEEIRGLRKLVITLIVGGQLFTGGLNLAGVGYWLRQHESAPHAATVQMIAAARAEEREDVRELRREILDVRMLLAKRSDIGRSQSLGNEGGGE